MLFLQDKSKIEVGCIWIKLRKVCVYFFYNTIKEFQIEFLHFLKCNPS